MSMFGSYGRIMLVGNVGRDPEMRYTPSGTAVTNFSIAVNRSRRGQDGEWQDETDWYRVTFFGRQAEMADQHVSRGIKLLVDGEPSIQTWTGQDGVERTNVEVRGDRFVILTPRGERMDPMGAQGSGGSQPPDSFDDEDLDDVPF